jgi:hypothetical protein
MPVKQGDRSLLDHEVAKELLASKIPARLAYIWTDGTPRVVPIWFHWNGRELVLATPPKAPKLKTLLKNPKVALTIDDNTFPHKVLMIRGRRMWNTCKESCRNMPRPRSDISAKNRQARGFSRCERPCPQWRRLR